MDTQIRDLSDDLHAFVENIRNEGLCKMWAKVVTSINTVYNNGYSFDGYFVSDGTIIAKLEPTIFLVATSRKRRTILYDVVFMDESGELHPTNIGTTNSKRGWALRIRDDVKLLLNEMSEQPKKESVTIEVPMRVKFLLDEVCSLQKKNRNTVLLSLLETQRQKETSEQCKNIPAAHSNNVFAFVEPFISPKNYIRDPSHPSWD